MMQREYAALVDKYAKLNIQINKTKFSLLLQQVCDTILKPSTIVKAFETCGDYPFDFTKSYAYKKIPPLIAKSPKVVEADNNKAWEEDHEEPATPPPTVPVMDTHILSYFSVFYMDLFDEVFMFESLSLFMIRWLVMRCHQVHN